MSKKYDIAFFTDANEKIGIGHLIRCISLAEEFSKRGFGCIFFLPEESPYRQKVNSKEIDYCLLDRSAQNYREKVLELLNQYDVDHVLVDLVEKSFIQHEFLGDFRREMKYLLSSITLFPFSDELRYEDISFHPIFEPLKTKVLANDSKTKFYSGKEFLVFQPNFTDYSSSVRKKARKILLTMGGADPANLTLKVVKGIADQDIEMDLILSADHPTRPKVEQILQSGTIEYNLHDFTENMPELMSSADIAVINGGLTRYELCIVGTPFIAISLHETQFNITKKVTSLGTGINLGTVEEITEEKIKKSVLSLLDDFNQRSKMAANMKGILDTNGPEKIYNILRQEFKSRFLS